MISNIVRYYPKVLKPIFNHFTAGDNITNLIEKSIKLQNNNLMPIVDYIKENVKSDSDINKIINEYKKISDVNNIEYIAIKLSSFNFSYGKIYNTCDYALNKKKKILIDAEEVVYQNKIEELTNYLVKDFNKEDINIYKTYQMYRIDSYKNLLNDFNNNDNIGIKLVRGAYYNLDKNTNLLFNKKEYTDKSYTDSINFIFDNLNKKNISAFICTHNKYNIEQLIKLYDNKINKHIESIKHASLLGFINDDTDKLKLSKIKVYKYLPYGYYEDSIPYLIRRIEENPKILKYMF